MVRTGLTLLLAVMACWISSCGASSGQRVKVLTASSVAQVVESLDENSELGVDSSTTIELVVDGSDRLVRRLITEGEGDVLVTADEVTMGAAADAGVLTGTPRPIALNRLAIVSHPSVDPPPGTLAELAEMDSLAVCVPSAPCGRASLAAATTAGVRLTPTTEELSVRAVLTRVRSGEIDAGLVYRSDLQAAGDSVNGVTLGPEVSEPVTLMVATVSDRPEAQLVVDALIAEPARLRLGSAGFEPL